LREFVIVQIRVEHRKVLDLGKAIQVGRDGIVAHKWAIGQRSVFVLTLGQGIILVFPNIVIGAGFLIDIIAFETTVRGVFFILAPADSLRLEQVNDGLSS
jgi:hypothetical protein